MFTYCKCQCSGSVHQCLLLASYFCLHHLCHHTPNPTLCRGYQAPTFIDRVCHQNGKDPHLETSLFLVNPYYQVTVLLVSICKGSHSASRVITSICQLLAILKFDIDTSNWSSSSHIHQQHFSQLPPVTKLSFSSATSERRFLYFH